MPELKKITYSKTSVGWSEVYEVIGYKAEEGDLTVMIRHHYPTLTTPVPPPPGWSSIRIDIPPPPDRLYMGIVTIDWCTHPYDGYINAAAPESILAVYKNGRIGNYVVQHVTDQTVKDTVNETPYRMPPVALSSTNSIVLMAAKMTTAASVLVHRVSVKTPAGIDVGFTDAASPYTQGKVISTAPVSETPDIDYWISGLYLGKDRPLTYMAYGVEIVDGVGPPSGGGGGGGGGGPAPAASSVNTCRGVVTTVGGVSMSTNDFVNAQELIKEVGSDDSDPTADEYEGYIANGKNDRGTTGIQDPLPVQTELPDPSPVKPVEKDETVKDTPAPQIQGCSSWSKGDYDAVMSTNFILRNFTVGYTDKAKNMERGCLYPNQLIDITNYNAQTRFCNLQALSQNVLEPIWAKFGPFRINSGIRNQNSVKSGVSQHVTGEAVDIQFPGWNYEMYWENAKWIKDNVPFDQFIFEHSSKTGLAWYHLSFRRSGNRPASDRTKVMTMYRGHYDSGLRRYK